MGNTAASASDGKKSGGSSRRRIIVRFLIVAVIGIVSAIGVRFYLHALSHESTDDAFVDGRIISVSPRVSGHVAAVHIADNQWVEAGALLVELDSSDFEARKKAAQASLEAAQAAGRVRKIEVNLTEISSTAGLDEAKANVESAQATLQTAQAEAAVAASQLDQARAQLASAQASLKQAEAQHRAVDAKYQRDLTDLKRIRTMAETKTISEQQLDHAVTIEKISAADLAAAKSKIETQQFQVQQAQAAVAAAEDQVRQSQAQVRVRKGQLDQARARLAAAKSAPDQVAQSQNRMEEAEADIEKSRAELQQASLNLSYTKIYAPSAGFITKKSVEPGAFVQVGQALMAVVPPDVWVTANFKETQLTRMHPGQPVKISIDTYPDVVFPGHIQSIQHGTGSRFSLLPPENATGNFVKVVQRVPVKIVFDREEQIRQYRLFPGLSVAPEVDIAADVRKTAGAAAAENGPPDDAQKSKPVS